MDAALAGHGYAKAAVDIACWDVLGQAAGLPVSTLLGGARVDDFPLYVAIPLGPVDDMVAHVRAAAREGIRRFQLKLGADPREDAARTRAVLEATEEGEVIVADANGGWRLQDATIAARALEGPDRVLFEQPCPTLEECLIVRERTTLPMVLDEVITDVNALLRARPACDGINLKLGRVGGLTKAKLLRDLGTELGLRFTIEDSWGGDLTTAAVAHLAASTKPGQLLMASFMNDWTLDHIAGYEPRSVDGRGSAPGGARTRRHPGRRGAGGAQDSRMTHAERTPRSIASRSCSHCTVSRSSRSPSPPSRRPPPPPATKPTVVLVHGAFADASGWYGVQERLEDKGYKVISPANPLRGVSADAAYLKSFLTTVSGPIVLVGHSYGGVVITNAATGNAERQGAGLHRRLRARRRRLRAQPLRARHRRPARPGRARHPPVPEPGRHDRPGGHDQARRLPPDLRRRPEQEARPQHGARPAPRLARRARRAEWRAGLEDDPQLLHDRRRGQHDRHRRRGRDGQAHQAQEDRHGPRRLARGDDLPAAARRPT